MVTVAQRRMGAQVLQTVGLSERRSCNLVGLSRTSFRYQPQPRTDAAIMARLRQLAVQHPRYGYRRMHALLQPEQPISRNRVQRLWRLAGLQVPPRRKHPRARKGLGRPPLRAERPDHVWTYDILEDATSDRRKLRIVTLLDEFTRECLAIEVARQLPATAILAVLQRVIATGRQPVFVRSDNGGEFAAQHVCAWLYAHQIDTYHIQPASPWQNGYVESFHAHLRDECLEFETFLTVWDCQVVLTRWRAHYNGARPHSSLGYRTPTEFARAWHTAAVD